VYYDDKTTVAVRCNEMQSEENVAAITGDDTFDETSSFCYTVINVVMQQWLLTVDSLVHFYQCIALVSITLFHSEQRKTNWIQTSTALVLPN